MFSLLNFWPLDRIHWIMSQQAFSHSLLKNTIQYHVDHLYGSSPSTFSPLPDTELLEVSGLNVLQAHLVQVRQDVLRNLDILAPGGGFVFQQIHNIQANVPPENILAMFDAAYEFG